MTTVRRISQVAFFFGFLILIMFARYPVNGEIPHNALVRYNPITQILLLFHGNLATSSILTCVVTLIIFSLIGRAFCGWICPVGCGLDFYNRFLGKYVRKHGRDVNSRALRVKYVLLVSTGILLLFGVSLFWFLDPSSMFTRNTALIIHPILDSIVRSTTRVLSDLPVVGYPIEKAMRYFFNPLPVTSVYLWVFLIFLTIMFYLDSFARRYFCKVLCPLGAFLGWLSAFSPFRIEVTKSKCVKCRKCESVCKTKAISLDEHLDIDRNECVLCMACLEPCPTVALRSRTKFQGLSISSKNFSKTRRELIFGSLSALVIYPLFRFGDRRIERPKHLIRPPGAIPEDSFSQVCAKCGSCMKVCYTSGIQPVMLEYGVDNMFTPRMDYSLGFCGYECNDCGNVCPTGAITFMPIERKRQALMGLAVIDRELCLPWAEKKPCLTCEEVCPIYEKAIELEDRPVVFDYGIEDIIKLPHVIKENCIGCGICEMHCPVDGIKAIRITYTNETRGGIIRETPPIEHRVDFETDESTGWK